MSSSAEGVPVDQRVNGSTGSHGHPNKTLVSSVSFSPVQACMVALLGDGLPHSKQELHGCLHDDLGNLSNIGAHLTAIRKKLPPDTLILIEVIRRRTHYRMVKTLLHVPPPSHAKGIL